MVTLMMQIIFWKRERSSVLLDAVDLQVRQLPPANTVHSRKICQMFSKRRSTDSAICMNRPNMGSADSAVSRADLRSFLLGLQQIFKKRKVISFLFLFYKLWILGWWRWVTADIHMTLRHQHGNQDLPNIYFVNKNLPSPPHPSLCAIR